MTAQEMRDSLRAASIPEHLWGGIIRYVIDGIRPGDFLCAVIRMDIEEALRRAFLTTRPAIPTLTTWFLTEAPADCAGTPTAVDDWISKKRIERESQQKGAQNGNTEG